MELSQGFRGHTVVGSSALALLEEALQAQLDEIQNKMLGDLGQGQRVNVFVAGSIMGGTGASGLPTVAKILDKRIDKGRDKFWLGCVEVLPYFRFEASKEDIEDLKGSLYVKADDFLLNSRAALQHYALLWDSGRTSPFDSTYFVGDNSPRSFKFSAGGPLQKNPSHYVELLSSFAALDFFERTDTHREKHEYYAGPAQAEYTMKNPSNVIDWSGLPLDGHQEDFKKGLLHFTCVGRAFLDFYYPLLREDKFYNKPKCTPWLLTHFNGKKELLGSPREIETQKLVGEYFDTMFFPWLTQVLDSADDVHILSRESNAKPSIHERLTNLLPSFHVEEEMAAFPYDRLWNNMCDPKARPAGVGTGKLLNLIYASVQQFCKDLYKL